jgi:hypothetical protein
MVEFAIEDSAAPNLVAALRGPLTRDTHRGEVIVKTNAEYRKRGNEIILTMMHAEPTRRPPHTQYRISKGRSVKALSLRGNENGSSPNSGAGFIPDSQPPQAGSRSTIGPTT